MNRLLLILIAVFTLFDNSFAARRKCVLKIELNDHSPMTVAIDNRDYKKVGASMTFGDLPTGRHYLRVYTYNEYKNGNGGHAKLVYTGSVRLRKNTVTNCVVYPANGEMVVTTHEMISDNVTLPNNVHIRSLSDNEMNVLSAEVHAELTDTDKMKLLQSKLAKATYTTAQVVDMMSWFNFEESKLDFAKWAYKNTSDKNNYRNVEKEFDYEASVKDLESFISASR